MKKFLQKSWWLLALASISIGAILTFTGWCLGASDHFVFIDNDGLRVANYDDNDSIALKETDLPEFVDIDISAVSASIELIPSDYYGFDVALPTRGSKLCWSVEDGKLSINTKQDWIAFFNIFSFNFWFHDDYSVKVYYPKDAIFNNIDLEAVSGNINISGISLKSLSASTVSGDIRIDAKGHETIKLKTTSGNIVLNGDVKSKATVEASSVSGDLDLKNISWKKLIAKTTSGNVKVSGEMFGQSSVKSVSGNVDVKLSKTTIKPSYDLSSVSGDIDINGQRMGNPAKSSSSSPDNLVTVGTVSGNIKLEF